MATSHFPATIPRPTTRHSSTATVNPTPFFLSPPKYIIKTKSLPPLKLTHQNTFKWVVKLRSIAQEESPPKPTTFYSQKLVDFLNEDLPHLFDDQGIDRTAYDERVKFRDPITKHDSISGYLFNIAMLRKLFTPDFQLHSVRQTGPYEITTRWTMVMRFLLLPWKPELVFTGTSVMGINPETKKFCSHILRFYKTPDLETPKYHILKRTANYEVPNVLIFFIDVHFHRALLALGPQFH